MAANGISTLPNKRNRKFAKIALAEAKRQTENTAGFRDLHYFVDSVAPNLGRPWIGVQPEDPGLALATEDFAPLSAESGNPLATG